LVILEGVDGVRQECDEKFLEQLLKEKRTFSGKWKQEKMVEGKIFTDYTLQ
jgi:hypothetical protein